MSGTPIATMERTCRFGSFVPQTRKSRCNRPDDAQRKSRPKEARISTLMFADQAAITVEQLVIQLPAAKPATSD